MVAAIGALCSASFIESCAADVIRPAIHTYTVQKGDTLWGIANEFLRTPWDWKKLWNANPSIKNPNLIYPDEVIQLYKMGNGHLALRLRHQLLPTLSDHAIPSYHVREFIPYLPSHLMITNIDEYKKLPYLAASDHKRIEYSTGDILYTDSQKSIRRKSKYRIVKLGSPLYGYKDKLLGYTLINVGKAVVVHSGPPTAVQITSCDRGVTLGDRLITDSLQHAKNVHRHFLPSAPDKAVYGKIIAKMNTGLVSTSGELVVIDQGKDAGLHDGNVLQVAKSARFTITKVNGKKFTLPADKIGDIMVVKVFKNVSYAIITTSRSGVTVGDNVYYPVSGPTKIREEAKISQ